MVWWWCWRGARGGGATRWTGLLSAARQKADIFYFLQSFILNSLQSYPSILSTISLVLQCCLSECGLASHVVLCHHQTEAIAKSESDRQKPDIFNSLQSCILICLQSWPSILSTMSPAAHILCAECVTKQVCSNVVFANSSIHLFDIARDTVTYISVWALGRETECCVLSHNGRDTDTNEKEGHSRDSKHHLRNVNESQVPQMYCRSQSIQCHRVYVCWYMVFWGVSILSVEPKWI